MSDRPGTRQDGRDSYAEARRLGWVLGRRWTREGLHQPGWVLLPLRLFLGVTFIIAGVQKLASPTFFNPHAPTSVHQQMLSLAPHSPIGPLVAWSVHSGLPVGLLIALGELAVGVGALVGLLTRLAAAGGAVLALTFFLTVSWNTSPYYYGADIVFLFAWTPFLLGGAWGVASVDGWLSEPLSGNRHTAPAARSAARTELRYRQRRALLAAGSGAVVLAGVAALVGRLAAWGQTQTAGAGSRQTSTRTDPERHRPSAKASGTPTHGSTAQHPPAGMSAVAPADFPVGQGRSFRDPGSGGPAWLVRVTNQDYVAFSAICTHAGCTVGYDPASEQFRCPCHGGTFNARTGQVVAGPPPAPLSKIPVRQVSGKIYAK